MSLDISLEATITTDVYSANITHNLTEMADEVGIYRMLWKPSEAGVTSANQLIGPLESAIAELKSDPCKYRAYDSPNGWGIYDDFVPWLEKLLQACKDYPDAEISVSI